MIVSNIFAYVCKYILINNSSETLQLKMIERMGENSHKSLKNNYFLFDATYDHDFLL